MSKAKLHIVHCIDTEGPLKETLYATFKRLKDSKGIIIKPTLSNLIKLQNQLINLKGKEKEVADYLDPKRLAYLDDWNKVSEMINEVTSVNFRNKYSDSKGGGYTFSWLIIDVIGYKNNPRKKTTGFHKVFDRYQNLLKNKIYKDVIGWHFHTVPVGRNALEYNTSWTNNDFHEQVLCRRLIERNSFPNVFRAGATIERNDISYWLEQFIPFDYSCSSTERREGGPGWDYDWRFSPKKWGYYHPDINDYRKVGGMNRSIFRCLDIDTLHTSISQKEVNKAFNQVKNGESTVLAVSGHDRRDLRPEIDYFYNLVLNASKKYKDVEWIFNNAVDAAREVINIKDKKKLILKLKLETDILKISANKKIFGSIPFIAIEEKNNVFFRANPTIEKNNEWVYKIPRIKKSIKIGVAANDYFGNTAIQVIEI